METERQLESEDESRLRDVEERERDCDLNDNRTREELFLYTFEKSRDAKSNAIAENVVTEDIINHLKSTENRE